ncbi:hypothetical protein [Duganella vulcania]|uniref:Uncharacterized protein n=1 Tax=Duganella vulcania TaxID=2692166 RepID=A0A845GFZ8_9BURK|nr:hypothetical protein [Duganella vulcania]MYM92305.1 hypothetical protein [Duganella vulcania]
MRIPVSKADLAEGHFTQIARSLQKLWPEELSLMQAQNTLAGLFGYRNLHDVQANARDANPTSPPLMFREAMAKATAWRIARRLQLPLLHAAALTSRLHLESLSIDEQTFEAASERTRKAAESQGKFILMDEAWSLFSEQWNPENPMLLDAGIPGYSFAVLPDGRLFRWSMLEELIKRLPQHYTDDLAQEPQFAGMAPTAIKNAFLLNELYPQACTALVVGIKAAQIRPHGFSIIWLFDRDRQCVGRALRNDAIGGIIPAIYGIEDDAIFEAIGKLLKGEIIAAPTAIGLAAGQPLYTLRYGQGLGYDFSDDIQQAVSNAIKPAKNQKPDLDKLAQLPAHIQAVLADGRPTLQGQTFNERGQIYLRDQRWIKPGDMPAVIVEQQDIPAQIRAQGSHDFLDSPQLLPEPAIALHELAKVRQQQLLDLAAQALCNEAGIAQLTGYILNQVDPATFNAHCNRDIDDALPRRYEDELADNPDLVREREFELTSLRRKGEETKMLIPGLTAFEDTSVGLVLLLLHGEYPGSRHSSFVTPPEPGDYRAIAQILAGVIYYAQALAPTSTAPERTPDNKLLLFTVHRVVTGAGAADELLPLCRAIAEHARKMRDQTAFLQAVDAWRRVQDDVENMRKDGQLLYVGAAIARERPKSLSELMMGYGRTKAVQVHHAEQALPMNTDTPRT